MSKRILLAVVLVLIPIAEVVAKGRPRITMVEVTPQRREVAAMDLPAWTVVEHSWIEEAAGTWSSPYLTRVTVFEHATICGAALPPNTTVTFAESDWSSDAPHQGDDGRLMFWTPATDVEIDGVVALEGVELVLRCAPAPGQRRVFRATLAAPTSQGALGLPAGSEVTWMTDGRLDVRFGGWARSHGIAVSAHSLALVDPDGRFRRVVLGGDGGLVEIAGVVCSGGGQAPIALHPSGAVERCLLGAPLVVDERTVEACTPVELDADGGLVDVEPQRVAGCHQR